MKKIMGVGINDANYLITKSERITNKAGKRVGRVVWVCPFYQTWHSMLARCYSEKYKQHSSAYIGCTVDQEWHTFSNFKSWMEKQDWEGNFLDKDLLKFGNKVYSKDTCVFVSRGVNNFVRGYTDARNLIGVVYEKRYDFWTASVRVPNGGKRKYLGSFDTKLEAHRAWLRAKIELIPMLDCSQEVKQALKTRFEKGLELNDEGPR